MKIISLLSIAALLSACSTTSEVSSEPAETQPIEQSAKVCATQLRSKGKDLSDGSVNWNYTSPTNSQYKIPLWYITLASDGAHPGSAWRRCMATRGVDVSQLDLSDKDMQPIRFQDIDPRKQ